MDQRLVTSTSNQHKFVLNSQLEGMGTTVTLKIPSEVKISLFLRKCKKKTALIERCFLYEESLLVNLIITLNRPGMVYLHWQTWSQFRIHRKYSPI